MGSKATWNMPPEYVVAQRVPERIGRFHIVSVLGAGGMGCVYAAQDAAWNTPVALKTVGDLGYRDPGALRAEFRATAQLRHPNLVSLYELGCEGNQWFFTMEWLQGGTLGALNPTDKRLPRIFAELAAVVHAIHGEGLLHLDIKPSNIVMRGDAPVLLDFGIARLLGSGAVDQGPVVGTPGFTAPERHQGQHDVGADWFALGITLSRILGEAAEGHPLAELARRWSQPDPAERGAWADAMELVDAQPIPFAARLRGSGTTSIGRSVELAHLHAAWREPSGPIVVSMRGPSGVGKAWLARSFAGERVDSDGARLLVVRCHPREPSAWRVVDALLEALDLPARPSADADPAVWGRWAGVGGVESIPEALTGVIERGVAARIPVGGLLLILRDAQWADLDSATVVGRALARIATGRVLVIVTLASAALDDGVVPFTAELQRHLRHRDVVVGPLPLEVAVRWLAEASPSTSAADARTVAERSQGIPFLLAQGVYGLPGVLANLTPSEQDLLRTVAVAGMPLPLGVAVAGGGTDESPVDTITRLEIRGLILVTGLAPGDQVECRHALIREAVEAGLAPAAREAVHRALAHRATPEMSHAFLAYHLLGGGDPRSAAAMARVGASEATRRGAYVRSAQLWRLAANAEPQAGDWAPLTTSLLAAGHRAEAAEVILGARTDEAALVEAAGHLLAAGAVHRGREVLRPVLTDVHTFNRETSGDKVGRQPVMPISWLAGFETTAVPGWAGGH